MLSHFCRIYICERSDRCKWNAIVLFPGCGAHRLSCCYCILSVKCQYRSFATDACLLYVIVLTLDIVLCGIRTVSSNEPTEKIFSRLQSLVQVLCESNSAFPFIAGCINSRSLKRNYDWIHVQMSVWIATGLVTPLISGFHHSSLLLVTFINQLNWHSCRR
jgi:hypothetical protein